MHLACVPSRAVRRNGEFDSLSMSEQLELEGENCSIQCDHCESWYRLRHISMATGVLAWLRFTYIFEKWYP
jgi:hypothetical protein